MYILNEHTTSVMIYFRPHDVGITQESMTSTHLPRDVKVVLLEFGEQLEELHQRTVKRTAMQIGGIGKAPCHARLGLGQWLSSLR